MEIANAMNKKSLLDRDNIELYILPEAEEQMLVDFIMELNEIDVEFNDDEGTDFYTQHELENLDWDDPGDSQKFVHKLPLQEWQEEILNKEFGDEKK